MKLDALDSVLCECHNENQEIGQKCAKIEEKFKTIDEAEIKILGVLLCETEEECKVLNTLHGKSKKDFY